MPTPDHAPIQVSDLIFSSASQDINRFSREVARSRLSIRSRLRSIVHDAGFVASVARQLGLPLIANERCGSWYVSPDGKQGSAYFKSTDGHFGQWGFSLRRLNLPLLDFLGEHGGCIIVDSTRRGKSMPDALSKTIPIWAAVWNTVFFPDHPAAMLQTPPSVVSSSEHAQICARIPDLVTALRALPLDFDKLRPAKPLRPLWTTQASIPPQPPLDDSVLTLVLCTASSRDAVISDSADYDYVQGAADDAESWALGLTPPLFWAHTAALLGASDDELPGTIADLTARSTAAAAAASARKAASDAVRIAPTEQLYLGTTAPDAGWDLIIDLRPGPPTNHVRSSPEPEAVTMHVPLQPGKLGSRALRQHLPTLMPRVRRTLAARGAAARVLVVCATGRDHGVGVALAVLGSCFDRDGRLGLGREAMGKDEVRRRLTWVLVARDGANPSRATLQSVNDFLLG